MRQHTRNLKKRYKGPYKKSMTKSGNARRFTIGLIKLGLVIAAPASIILVAVNYKNNQLELYSKTYEIDESFAGDNTAELSDQDVFMPGNNFSSNNPDTDLEENSYLNAAADTTIGRQYGYPREIIEMLDRYPETIEFVKNYSTKKDSMPAQNVGYVQPDTIPLLIQWDERWGYSEYGDFLIATDGCGPTSLSMVIVGLTGDVDITPYVVASFAEENGYYEPGVGSKWTLMTVGAKHFGVEGTEIALSKEVVIQALEDGHPIICSVSAGDFTTGGHFIVLAGVENGKIKVNDPNSRVQSSKLWDYERLEGQINNLWSYSLCGEQK